MLDVAIGLVLVFAILSLMTTAIQEAHVAVRNERGKNLVRLVCSLVGDNSALSQKILNHPFLTTMSMELKNGSQRRPSYLDGDVFVTGLLGFLTQEYLDRVRPASPQQMVDTLKRKMDKADSSFITSLETLVAGTENDWPGFELRLKAWFDAVAERSSGWYKRANQLQVFWIGLALAVALNINVVVICKALWSDGALRGSFVEQAGLALLGYRPDSAPPLAETKAAPQAAAAPVTIRSLDRHLTTMQVAFASLQRPPDQEFRDGRALALATLITDAGTLRSLLAQERNASGNDAKQQRLRDETAAKFDLQLETIGHLTAPDADCIKRAQVSQALCQASAPIHLAVNRALQDIALERDARDAFGGGSTAARYRLLERCDSTADAEVEALCEQLRAQDASGQPAIPIGWSGATWPHVWNDCADKQKASAKRRCLREANDAGPAIGSLGDVGNWGIALGGWLITAIGITLGAPFWFDILGKLVKVRSSGNKSNAEDKTGNAEIPKPSTLSKGKDGDDAATGVSDDAMNELERALRTDEIVHIQRALGMAATEQSGRLDLATRNKLAAWQKLNGLSENGELSDLQAVSLLHNSALSEEDDHVG
ncbi:hypothetical protein [Massilia sp. CF038]|uniref:hypothetical protein n=1 Tax=Massilia sp. CF038 TaxID=1881045 RepID=UPI00091D0FA6|nr:hypothetical protein [Massilia sp. CF038]SHH62818.1 hypothetical protein SAMN05428948_4707 [Massilia sp. CF038]